jgi:hypothetical protein
VQLVTIFTFRPSQCDAKVSTARIRTGVWRFRVSDDNHYITADMDDTTVRTSDINIKLAITSIDEGNNLDFKAICIKKMNQ